MSVFLFIIIVSVSLLIIRAGALALEMTGMEKPTAMFQAVSCFTNTGFTTRASERVINHPRRRAIAMFLIITGNIGFVSVISTMVISLGHENELNKVINLLIMLAALLVIYKVFSHVKWTQRINQRLRKFLRKKLGFEDVRIEEILRQTDGVGVASVMVESDSPLLGKSLKDSGLTSKGLMVLSIQRGADLMPVPKADSTIELNDSLLLYGNLANIKTTVVPPAAPQASPTP